MKVFIKILGLIGLINCIVLYGAEHKSGDAVVVHLNRLEADRYVASSGASRGSQSQDRRSSTEALMRDFSNQYADSSKVPQQQPCEALISRFHDQDNRAFARTFLSNRTPEERQKLNEAIMAELPVNRTRRLSIGDRQADSADRPTPKENTQAVLLEAMICMMKKELELKEKIHQEKAAESAKQFEASGKQTERLTRRSQCLTCAGLVATAGNIAWAIYVGMRK